MFEHILVPLDGSSLAECVLPHVRTFASSFQARISLLQVLESASSVCQSQAVDPVDWNMCRASAETYLDEIAERLTKDGYTVNTFVQEGKPAQRIVEFIHSRGADLTALSSHGRSGLSEWNVSGVGQKIISRAKISSLLVRAYQASKCESDKPVSYNKILFPLDGSQRAECALSASDPLSRGALRLLVHAISRPEMPPYIVRTPEIIKMVDTLVQRNLEASREHFQTMQNRLSGNVDIRIMDSDDLNASLHDLVEAEDPDLVVLSAHGYSGKRRWCYGSVASSFIAYCSRPLLVVQDLAPEEMEPTQAELATREKKGH